MCGWHIKEYLPLSTFYTENLKKYGFKYNIEHFETLNLANYSCPICAASDRDRLYALFIGKLLTQIQNRKMQNFSILDFAPSKPLTNYIRRNIKKLNLPVLYRTADLYAEKVDDKVDIMNMMGIYKNNQFDFFICSHVLEHVKDDKKALRELYQILKPNGCGILMTPINLDVETTDESTTTDEEERWRRFGQFDHIRLYSKSDYLLRINEAGFFVRQLGKEYFGKNFFDVNGLSDKNILYVVEKKGSI